MDNKFKRMLKRIMALFLFPAMLVCSVGCENAIPEKDDFTFSVSVQKTELSVGEDLIYTVTVKRVDGDVFKHVGSSQLCSYYFERAEFSDTPMFALTDDYVQITIGKNFEYNKIYSINTDDCSAGKYTFAVMFHMGSLVYNFSQEITLK